jgi:hypothetical protein
MVAKPGPKSLTKKTHRTTDRAIPASKRLVGRPGNSTQEMFDGENFQVRVSS